MSNYEGLNMEGDFQEGGFELNLVTGTDTELITYITLYRGDSKGSDDVRFRGRSNCHHRLMDYMIDGAQSLLGKDYEAPESFEEDGLLVPRPGALFHRHNIVTLAMMSFFGESPRLGYLITHRLCSGPIVCTPENVEIYVATVAEEKARELEQRVGYPTHDPLAD